MNGVFLKLLDMSITSCYVILSVLIIRMFLKRAPKIFSYVLWSVVFIRLICPFSFESIISLVPTNNQALVQNIQEIQSVNKPTDRSEHSDTDRTVNNTFTKTVKADRVTPLQMWIIIGRNLWILGMGLLLVYCLISTLLVYRRLRNARWISDNIYETESIQTAFVFGLITPKIYLPAFLKEEREYILKHEQTHIRRKDNIIKFLAFIVVCIHWFNPLAWIAFFLMGEDIELSCDESVIKEYGAGIKKEYSTSLLMLSTGRRIIGGVPLAFGENNTKNRIKNILHYKKPAFGVIIVTVLVLIASCIGLLSNQKQNTQNINPKTTTDKKGNLPVSVENTNSDNDEERTLTNIGSVIWYFRKYKGADTNYQNKFERYEIVREELNPDKANVTVLEDKIWNGWDKYNFILSSQDRFIYLAAKDNTLESIETPVLVSVARDGGSRRIYEAPYHTINQLTMDEKTEKIYFTGWTKDQTFPQPMYEIDSELRNSVEVQQLNGWLITVYDGYAYYFTADKKQPGIYRIAVLGNQEPELYEKLGFVAESYTPVIYSNISITEVGEVTLSYQLIKQDGKIDGSIKINGDTNSNEVGVSNIDQESNKSKPDPKDTSIEDYANEEIVEYLKNPNGKLLKQTADNFVKAYFTNNEKGLKKYLSKDFGELYGHSKRLAYGKNVYDKLNHILAKWYSANDKKAEVQYEYQVENNNDGYIYLGILLKYSKGKWLITDYYSEM